MREPLRPGLGLEVQPAQQQLAGIAGQRGDTDTARALLYKAMEAAEQGDLKDERKAIRKKIDALGA